MSLGLHSVTEVGENAMMCRSRLGWCVGLMTALWLVPRVGSAEDEVWVGREFVPRSTCRPKIGIQDIPLNRLPLPFKVQQVRGEWLWVGQAWVKKRDVTPVVELIEEFSVDRWGNSLMLPVTIRGRRHYFTFDTGSEYCVVDSTLRSAFPASEDQHGFAAEDPPLFRRLEDTYLGTSRMPVHCDAICLDLSNFRWPSGYGIHGVLGMNFLNRYVVQFEFDSGKLSFMKAAPHFAQWQLTARYDAERPVWEVEFDDRGKVPFLIDTGMVGGPAVQLESGIFQELVDRNRISHVYDGKVQTLFGVVRRRFGTIDHFGIAGWELKSPQVGEGSNMLGLNFLKGRVILFDFPNKSIHVRKK